MLILNKFYSFLRGLFRQNVCDKDISGDLAQYSWIKKWVAVDGCRRDVLFAKLEADGWKDSATQGSFSRVMISPVESMVIRIGSDKAESYSYHAVASIENEGNPYFQKIYWHFSSFKGFTVTVMECLQCYNSFLVCDKCEVLMDSLEKSVLTGSFKDVKFEAMEGHLAQCIKVVRFLMEEFSLKSDIHNNNVMERKGG